MVKFRYGKGGFQVGRRLVSKEVRDINDIKDQLIDILKQKNDAQEKLLAAQDELISELTQEINALKETLRLVRENQQPEKEPGKEAEN